MSVKFRSVRESALNSWLAETGRSVNRRSPVRTDSYEGAFECKWQKQLCAVEDEHHCPLCCWIGTWGSGVTDILLSKQFDLLPWPTSNEKSLECLSRYIHRLMLVGLEVLGGLEDLTQIFGMGRQLRNANSGEVDKFINYVNEIIKHRRASCCYMGHHPRIEIDWSHTNSIKTDFPKLSKAGLPAACQACGDESSALEVPSPMTIVTCLVNAYRFCDQALLDQDVKRLIETFRPAEVINS